MGLNLAKWFLFGVYCPNHPYGDDTIAGEGLQIMTYARQSWPLSSEDSLTCHIYCDMGLPFIMVISKDPWHSHLMLSVWQWSCNYLFLQLNSVATEDWTPIYSMRGERFTSRPLWQLGKWVSEILQWFLVRRAYTCIKTGPLYNK